MRPILHLLLTAALILSGGVSLAADWSVRTILNYDWWNDSPGNRGMQGYLPFKIEARHQDFSASVLTGYAFTRFDPHGAEVRSLSHLLDTKINLSYEIADKLPVDLLIGLDFNLPTGKTHFKQRDLSLIMDPDLVSINNFGEGFNFNPTLSLAKQFGNWVGGLGVGYVRRGNYDFSTNFKDYHPGDIFNLTAEIRYFFSSRWNGRLFGKFAWYNEGDWKVLSPVTSRNSWKEGDFFNTGLAINYDEKKWNAGLLVQGIFREKGRFRLETIGLFTEADIKRGNEWLGDLYFRYMLDDKTALKSSFEYLYKDENSGSPTLPRFVGRREKYSFGLGATRTLSRYLEGEAYVKGFYMHDGEATFPEPRNGRSSRGFSTGLHLTSRF
ncbi:MAG: hypothetical protein EHM36_14200 [Deltaproteobacteria bacterium]|nr:MAG: hypothetical protein EHM36_14200 [Deltaproteobacteria bacterium]